MKLLKTVKIINWHYFWNQTLNFEQIVFLTGVNASGKSTLIDAMQVVLLGDTSGRHFNKAAAEKSNRTLRGYLRGELGDSLEGGFHYLRNGRFTSYIVLEFYDDVNDDHFNLGIVFDVFDDGGVDHRFFMLEAPMPENEFIIDNVPMEYKDLNLFFQEHYPNKYKFFDTNRQYQDALKRKLGNLKDKYFSLLKKAVSFSPITDITTFITEYVTEAQGNIDIAPMQENILQYKKLEDEAALMRFKVERLNEIAKNYEVYKGHKEQLTLFEYVLEKATLQNDLNRLATYDNQYLGYQKRLTDIESELADLDVDLAELNKRRVKLIQDSSSNDTYRITDEINEHKKVAEEKIKSLKFLNMQVRSDLENYVLTFDRLANEVLEKVSAMDEKRLKKDGLYAREELLESAETIIKENHKITSVLNKDINELSETMLNDWRSAQAKFKQHLGAFNLSLDRLINDYQVNEAILKQQELNLRGGGKPYEY
ncbi:MAG TPA: ATP-binding protein, partial [Bacilli bacterium]|nr:ATP-binding protein [Bacilli bacterium]